MPALKGSILIGAASMVALGSLALFGGSTTTTTACGGAGSSGQTATAPPNVVLDAAIKAVSTINGQVDNELAVSMHFGVNIESGGDPYNDVSHDGASGYYRIQKVPDIHPDISIDGTRDPVVSTNYMAPAYRNALVQVNRIAPNVWKTNPELGAEQVADIAEGPAVDYYVNRPTDVPIAFNEALTQLTESGISTDFSSGGAGTSVQLVSTELGGCQSPGTGSGQVSLTADNASRRQAALVALNSTLGMPYSYGGGGTNGPSYGQCGSGAAWNDCHILGFDCSGLMQYVLAQAGVSVPRISSDQYNATVHVTTATSLNDLSHAQPGDLVFFTGSDGTFSSPGHVGMYIGNGRMIDAPESGQLVQVTDLVHSSYWQSTFVAITDPYANTPPQ